MTIAISAEQLPALARKLGQSLLDKLAEGLMDEPQDELIRGTAAEIETAIRAAVKVQREVWNPAWDM